MISKNKSQNNKKPRIIIIASRFLYIQTALGLSWCAVYGLSEFSLFMIDFLLFIIPTLFISYKWGRLVFTVIFVFDSPKVLYGLFLFEFPLLEDVNIVVPVTLIMRLVVLILLFLPDANKWYRSISEMKHNY